MGGTIRFNTPIANLELNLSNNVEFIEINPAPPSSEDCKKVQDQSIRTVLSCSSSFKQVFRVYVTVAHF